MNKLYVFILSGTNFYATGSLNDEDIIKIKDLACSFMRNYSREQEETIFESFIEEVLTKYKIRLTPIRINYVFRVM